METQSAVRSIPTSQLFADENQPRKTFPQSALRALGETMQARISTPLVVRDGIRAGEYIIVDGERRWRAAQLVGITELPCLIETYRDALEIAAVQITTAGERESLSIIDVAEFLEQQRAARGLSQNELSAELSRLGLKRFEGQKVANVLRFAGLPPWAKKMIRDGTLPESVATALFPYLDLPAVLKDVGTRLQREAEYYGRITKDEALCAIQDAVDDATVRLDGEGAPKNMKPAMKPAECRDCSCYRKIDGIERCVDRPRWIEKNEAAKKAQAERDASGARRRVDREDPDPSRVPPLKLKTDAAGLVTLSRSGAAYRLLAEARFETEACIGCAHHRMGKNDYDRREKPIPQAACFHLPCFAAKSRAAAKSESRRERLAELLYAWLLATLTAEAERLFPGGSRRRAAIIIWLATGAIDTLRQYRTPQREADAAFETRPMLLARQVRSLPQLAEAIEQADESWLPALELDLCRAALAAMSREQLRWWATHCADTLGDRFIDGFRITDEYLRTLRRAELIALATEHGTEDATSASVAALRALLLALAEKIGCPAEIRTLYEAPFAELPPFSDELVEEFDADELEMELDEADSGDDHAALNSAEEGTR